MGLGRVSILPTWLNGPLTPHHTHHPPHTHTHNTAGLTFDELQKIAKHSGGGGAGGLGAFV